MKNNLSTKATSVLSIIAGGLLILGVKYFAAIGTSTAISTYKASSQIKQNVEEHKDWNDAYPEMRAEIAKEIQPMITDSNQGIMNQYIDCVTTKYIKYLNQTECLKPHNVAARVEAFGNTCGEELQPD